jgi:hypothetical protein
MARAAMIAAATVPAEATITSVAAATTVDGVVMAVMAAPA